jgi:D-glycero-alpha-D-manno-heptose 1-phosphate guanylyltransferase
MIDEAIVLAGGFGTRLQKVVSDLPKPMAPVKDKPFLEYILDYLHRYGITKVVLSTGYMHEKVEEYFGKDYKGMQLNYAVEEEPLGTGGAIKYALEKISGEIAFVLNGDTFYDVNLRTFYDLHRESGADISLALRPVDDTSRYGSVQTDDKHRITAFVEKAATNGRGLINGGLYIIPQSIFEKINNFTANFSVEKDIFERYYSKYGFFGFPFDDYFIDIGIPEDYERANKEL